MRDANFVAGVVIMHCSEQSLATVSDFMTMLVIVICVGPENAGTTISNFLAMLVVMICAVRQNALTTEKLFHMLLQRLAHSSSLKRPNCLLYLINDLVNSIPCIIDPFLNHNVAEKVIAEDIKH
jgi:hypothetical protein